MILSRSLNARNLLGALFATFVVSLFAVPANAGAMTGLAHFPDRNNARLLGGPAISGSNVYFATKTGLRRLSIERIRQNRKREQVASYLLPRANAKSSSYFMLYRASDTSIAALLKKLDDADSGPVPSTPVTVWVGGGKGKLRRIPGRSAGLIAADAHHVATGFLRKGRSTAIKIHSTRNGRISQIRELDTKKLIGVDVPANDQYLGRSAIDLEGDLLAIATGPATFIVNWRTGVLLRTTANALNGAVVSVDLIAPVVITTTVRGGYRSPYSSSTQAIATDTGALLWSNASPSPIPTSTSDNLLTAAPDYFKINQVNPATGIAQPFAIYPSYLDHQESFIGITGVDMTANSFVWSERDCYRSRILRKQPMERAPRSRGSCPFEFSKGSMTLKGRKLSMVLSAQHGFTHMRGKIRHAGVSHDFETFDMPPGKHRVRIPLSRKLAAQIRRTPNRRTIVTFEPPIGSDRVVVSGRVRVER